MERKKLAAGETRLGTRPMQVNELVCSFCGDFWKKGVEAKVKCYTEQNKFVCIWRNKIQGGCLIGT